MATESIGTEDSLEGAIMAPQQSLPDWLARLIDPLVMAEHDRKVQQRIADHMNSTVRRRRCAEVVANYLLKEYSND